MPTWRSGIGLDSNLEVREGSGSPPGGPGGVRRPSQRAEKGRESLPVSRKSLPVGQVGSGGLPGGLECRHVGMGGVGRLHGGLIGPPERPGYVRSPTRRSGRGREDYPEVWEGRESHLKVQEGTGDPLGGPDGPPEGPGVVW